MIKGNAFISTKLIPKNIVSGVTIYGVDGTFGESLIVGELAIPGIAMDFGDYTTPPTIADGAIRFVEYQEDTTKEMVRCAGTVAQDGLPFYAMGLIDKTDNTIYRKGWVTALDFRDPDRDGDIRVVYGILDATRFAGLGIDLSEEYECFLPSGFDDNSSSAFGNGNMIIWDHINEVLIASNVIGASGSGSYVPEDRSREYTFDTVTLERTGSATRTVDGITMQYGDHYSRSASLVKGAYATHHTILLTTT